MSHSASGRLRSYRSSGPSSKKDTRTRLSQYFGSSFTDNAMTVPVLPLAGPRSQISSCHPKNSQRSNQVSCSNLNRLAYLGERGPIYREPSRWGDLSILQILSLPQFGSSYVAILRVRLYRTYLAPCVVACLKSSNLAQSEHTRESLNWPQGHIAHLVRKGLQSVRSRVSMILLPHTGHEGQLLTICQQI